MMNILVLGGTQFLGRHVVEILLAAGHWVSVFTRGISKDELPAQVERLRGDRDAGPSGLDALRGRSWDVCVDVSGYTPRQVRASAELLETCVRRYIFISAVSVYGDPDRRPVCETHLLLPPAAENVVEVNGETYGPLKVACENIVRKVYGGRSAVLRPQIVVGPHDQTARYSYWVDRVARGGEMLAPGDGIDHVQVIDVRDVARFVGTVVDDDLDGNFNLAGPRLTWAQFLAALGAENMVWVNTEIINSAGLTFLELPLFRPERGARSSLMDVNCARATQAGLTLTDAAVTARDTRAWIQSTGGSQTTLTAALPPEREAALIGLARAP